MSFSTTSSSKSPVERMNAYKGGEKKDFALYIRLAGVAIGSAFPYVLTTLAPSEWKSSLSSLDRSESVLTVLQSFSLFSVLFLNEFVVGVKARTISAKAAFSPAAAQMTNTQPFEVVQCNRIHQNQIESACIFVPAVVSAAAAGVDTPLLVASCVTWVLTRVLYRWGYVQEENPFWRLFGTASSLSQSLICLGLFAYEKFK